jgi:hypothetical protein
LLNRSWGHLPEAHPKSAITKASKTILKTQPEKGMKFFHVSYDLSTSKKNYQIIHKAIKAFEDWLHCQRSVWLIRSNLSAKQIYERLKESITDSDCLSVMEVDPFSAFGWIPKLEATWTISTSGGCFADIDFLSKFDN